MTMLKAKCAMVVSRDESTCVRYLMKAYRFKNSSVDNSLEAARMSIKWNYAMADLQIYNRNMIQAFDYNRKLQTI